MASFGAVLVIKQHRPRVMPMIAGALVTLAILVVAAPRSSVVANQLVVATSDELLLINGQHRLLRSALPHIGDARASKSMVVVMNYACRECVTLMKHLREVITELPADSLAIYFVPVATTPQGADALAMMLAIWQTNPRQHDELSREIIDGKLAFEAAAIAKLAIVDDSTLAKAKVLVQQNGKLIAAAEQSLGLRGYPQLWFPDGAVAGRTDNKAYYFELLAQHLQLRRTLEPRLIIEQTEIALGTMPMNARHQQELRFTNPGNAELEITGAELPEQWRLVTPMPLRVAAQASSKIVVDVVSPSEFGPWRAVLKLRSNVTADRTTVNFTGKAEALVARERSPVRVTPLRVVLPAKPSEQAQTWSISMTPDDATTTLRPEVELPAALREAGVTTTITPPDARNAIEAVLHFPSGFNATAHVGSRITLRSGIAPEFQLPLELTGQRPRPTLAQQTTR